MNVLVMATMVIVMTAAYLAQSKLLPAPVKFLPELMSAVLAAAVFFLGTRQHFRYVAPKYWLVALAMIAVVIFGILANGVGSGPILSGARYYFRAAPMFLLPAVVLFSGIQLRQQGILLVLLALLQIPLAISQRWTLVDEGRFTGDYVYGTLMISGVMTVFLIAVICVLAAFTFRNRLRVWQFVVLSLAFMLAIAVNETKVTLLLLPIGLLVTVWHASVPAKRARHLGISLAVLTLLGAVFIPIYDHYSKLNNPYGQTLGEFFTEEGALERYLRTDAGIGSDKEAGRVDAIVEPLNALSKDPIHLVLGLGIGNASNSNIGVNFRGEYFGVYGRYTITSTVATLILETGLLGLAIVVLFNAMLFRDAQVVARSGNTPEADFAAGWVGVIAVMTLGLGYLTLHVFDSLSYLYMYFSGLIAATRMRMLADRREGAPSTQPAGVASRLRSAAPARTAGALRS
ncbi:MAG: hypothetical protein R3E75_11935 [Steroidobacteraceae bacterium]|nr:hypothetical protein [Nevskiaceae bacterium]